MHILSHVWLFATPWTLAPQAPPSMGFSSQEYWSGLPLYSPGDCLDPGMEPMSLESVSCIGRQILYQMHHLGSPKEFLIHILSVMLPPIPIRLSATCKILENHHPLYIPLLQPILIYALWPLTLTLTFPSFPRQTVWNKAFIWSIGGYDSRAKRLRGKTCQV